MMDRLVGRNCIQFVWEGLTPLAIQLELFDYFILLSSQNPTKHFRHKMLSLTNAHLLMVMDPLFDIPSLQCL